MKNKLLIRIFFLVLFLSALAFLVFNENGILKYAKLKNEINNLENEINKAEEKLKQLQTEIDSLQKSDFKIEQVAREKYNMLKPNEKVFKVEEN